MAENNTEKHRMVRNGEFFIASASCKPGGCRFHENICLTKFNEALKFAINPNCDEVFEYGWNMNIWHCAIVDGVDEIVNHIDLNEYVIGALDIYCQFISVKVVREEIKKRNNACEDYKKVVYSVVPENILKNPIKKNTYVNVAVPDYGEDEIKHQYKLYSGYRWEHTSGELCDYKINDIMSEKYNFRPLTSFYGQFAQ
jgi:hypothetical protein